MSFYTDLWTIRYTVIEGIILAIFICDIGER